MEDGIWQYRFIDEAITYAQLSGFVVTRSAAGNWIAYRTDFAPGQEFYLIEELFNGKERYAWSR